MKRKVKVRLKCFFYRYIHSIFEVHMKNRLIYFLIGLMIVSLIGIILLQGVWISNAFKEGEREFATHVNDALNAVNEEIDEDEAALFIEDKLGGVDSLLHNVIVINELHGSESEDVVFLNSNPTDEKRTLKIEYSTFDSLHEEMDGLHEEMEELHEDLERIEIDAEGISWSEKYEFKFDNLDSVLEATVKLEEREHDLQRITNVVHHMTTERIYNGELAGRISKDELEEKITSALTKEGIKDSFEYAIMDHGQLNYAHDFMSADFDESPESGKEYSKSLFQNDRLEAGNYELILQIGNDGAYVWNKVRSMILLSIVFTVLILVCFGYSLYFIFKQKKISQVKNDFINNMTHELKTPLASISLAASSIKHPQVIGKPGEIEHFVDIIESEERRIHSHIEQVLDIASLDKSELQLNFVEADLIYLLKDSIKNVDLSLSESNGTSMFECTLSEAPITADEFHLTNVFTNILDNSIKYRSENLKINVSLTRKNNMYLVSIKDNGIGMSSKTQKLAFDKFFRAETGDIHNRKGFGLGLSYVKSIVEAHHGTVSLSSELNQGTTITVQLPVKA